MNFPSREFDEVLAALCHGTTTEAQVQALASLLRADPSARDAYLLAVELHARLASDAGPFVPQLACAKALELVNEPAGPGRALAAIRQRRPRGRRWDLAIGAAAVLLLVAVAAWRFVGRPEGRPETRPVAVRVLEADHATPAAWQPGQLLALNKILLQTGTLRLRIEESGVVLELLGPAVGCFETPMRLRLMKGGINADVGKEGHGFTVATAAGEVVDLGTRFAVDVSDDGETKTAVFSGQVRIDSVNSAGHRDKSWHLREGEAVRFHKREKPRRLASLRLSLSGSLPAETGQPSIIASVADNVADVDFHRFYGVVPGGMVDGASAYTDNHKQRWRALPGEVFPVELQGAELICPFQSDRHALDLKVTVVLSQPGIVYVMHDVRKPPPDWLARDFTRTDMHLRCGPWRPDGKVVQDVPPDETGKCFLHYSVWRKEVPVAGPVELGPPHLRGQGGPSAMYGIAVKPLPKLVEEP